jgi:hypothetical protein
MIMLIEDQYWLSQRVQQAIKRKENTRNQSAGNWMDDQTKLQRTHVLKSLVTVCLVMTCTGQNRLNSVAHGRSTEGSRPEAE